MEDFSASGDEDVEGEDVDDDGAEDEETPVAGAGDGDEDAADDFADFDEVHEAAFSDGGEEADGFGRGFVLGYGDEVEPEVQAEEDEEETEKAGGDVGDVFFHDGF